MFYQLSVLYYDRERLSMLTFVLFTYRIAEWCERRFPMPIVVISAYCSEKTVRQAISLGCSAYVKKPFKTEEVLEAARKALTPATE